MKKTLFYALIVTLLATNAYATEMTKRVVPGISPASGVAAPDCKLNVTATITINFNHVSEDLSNLSDIFDKKKAEIKSITEELEIKNLRMSYENYNINPNSYSSNNNSYNLNGSISYQMNDEKLAIALIKALNAKGFQASLSVSKNRNNYGGAFNCEAQE